MTRGRKTRVWLPHEDSTLTKLWGKKYSAKNIARWIPNTGPKAVTRRAAQLGLELRRKKRKDGWPEADEATLARMWEEGAHVSEIAIAIGRSEAAVSKRASVLDLPPRKPFTPVSAMGRDLNPETLNYDKLDRKFQELWAVKYGWRDYEDVAA